MPPVEPAACLIEEGSEPPALEPMTTPVDIIKAAAPWLVASEGVAIFPPRSVETGVMGDDQIGITQQVAKRIIVEDQTFNRLQLLGSAARVNNKAARLISFTNVRGLRTQHLTFHQSRQASPPLHHVGL